MKILDSTYCFEKQYSKNCTRCGEEKGIDDFFIELTKRSTSTTICRKCRYKQNNENRSKNKIIIRKNVGVGSLDITTIRRILGYKLDNSRQNSKKGKYAPCSSTIEELSLSFRTSCEICLLECGTKINLDHCHISGLFRGWLCSRCNTTLGRITDGTNRLLSVHYYCEGNK